MRQKYLVWSGLIVMVFCLFMSGCGKRVISGSSGRTPKGTYKPYKINGKKYTPMQSGHGYEETGLASWYGDKFHGRSTACGEPYNMYDYTAAHKVLPMQTKVRVTNLENGRSVDVRINDRGPFVRGRIIDVSKVAAQKLDIIRTGTAKVRVTALSAVAGYTAGGDMPGTFYVQVGSFTVKDNARNLMQALSKQYTRSRIQPAIIGGKRFWRVQAGTFGSLSSAKNAKRSLEHSYPSCFVIAD